MQGAWVSVFLSTSPPLSTKCTRIFLWIPDVMATAWQQIQAHAVAVTDEVNTLYCARTCRHASNCLFDTRQQPNIPGGNESLYCFQTRMQRLIPSRGETAVTGCVLFGGDINQRRGRNREQKKEIESKKSDIKLNCGLFKVLKPLTCKTTAKLSHVCLRFLS